MCLFALRALAQFSASPSTAQSTPELNWNKIEDHNFKIIFPDYIASDAKRIYSLLDRYRLIEGVSFGINPPKTHFIIRPEMSEPNGFVTRAPFRSEFFASSSFNPFIGGLDWFQALAIHEYRHIIQYKAFDSGAFEIGKVLFGDYGLSVLTFWTTSNWFFEGDAVWTETKYTDTGRGRSPRFMSYTRALVEANKFPSLDQLLAGDYSQPYPNHYVWGFLIITRARKLYGDDIWMKIIPKITKRFYNPFAIYSAFEEVTGKSFNDFYIEMVDDLKTKWPTQKTTQQEYKYDSYPIPTSKGTYFLRKTANDLSALYLKKNDSEEKIKEINIESGLSKVDYRNGKIIYTRNLPDSRYSYKGYSDIYIYNIEEDSNTKVTDEKRLYHPNYDQDGKGFIATEFTDLNKWQLSHYDLEGNLLNTIPTKGKIYEAVSIENGYAYISANIDGYKSLYVNGKEIVTKTRNSIFNLSSYENDLVFESDLNGRVSLISYNLRTGEFSRLTNEDEDAFDGRIFNGKISYVKETANGRRVTEKSLSRVKVRLDDIQNNYLSKNNYSDRYLNTAPVTENTSDKKDVAVLEYNRYEEFWKPHSWTFFGGRGYRLQGFFQNYLGDNTADVYVGRNSENGKPIAGGNYYFMKYYPIFGAGALYEDREEEFEGLTNKWSELTLAGSVAIPYIKRIGFYTIDAEISAIAKTIKISNDLEAYTYDLRNDRALEKISKLSLSLLKDKSFRRIFPQWGIQGYLKYTDADVKVGKDNRLVDMEASLFLPGFLNNAGLKLTYKKIQQRDDARAYRISLDNSFLGRYKFSRGYRYSFFPTFEVYKADYSFPVVNTSLRVLGDWLYMNRISANLFYDYTTFTSGNYIKPANKISNGIELNFETNVFRKLPIVFQVSFMNKQSINENETRLFIETNLGL